MMAGVVAGQSTLAQLRFLDLEVAKLILDSPRYQPRRPPPADWVGEMIRPDDLLHLVVSSYNLRPVAGPAGPRLERISPDTAAVIVFELPPQTIAEQAYLEPSSTKPITRPARTIDGKPEDGRRKDGEKQEFGAGDVATARIARPSRLVFRVRDDIESLPLSIEGLLGWDGLEPILAPLAALPPKPTSAELQDAPAIAEPGPLHTALELPYRLMLSPNASGRWNHSRLPVTHGGRTELWHTRLGTRAADGAFTEASLERTVPLRAIWSPELRSGATPDKKLDDPDLGTAAMNPNDRYQIVVLTSDYENFRRFSVPPVQPSPIQASQLMLSALGGWLRSRGHWDLPEVVGKAHAGRAEGLRLPFARTVLLENEFVKHIAAERNTFVRTPPDDLDLTEWVHVATQGRDHYVRLVYDGCLFPTGHRASMVKITERRFEEIDGSPVALLRQFVYVVVREPVRLYPRAAYPHGGREMPLESIEVKTLVTPHLRLPSALPALVSGSDARQADYSFWMLDNVTGLDVPFELVGTDAGGRRVPFSMPLIFVRRGESQMTLVGDQWRTATHPGGTAPRRRAVVNGATLDVAPGGPAGDNSVITARALYFDVSSTGGCGEYLPTLFKADVSLPSVEQIVGREATTTIGYVEGYLDAGFDADVGLFASIQKDNGHLDAAGTLGLGFAADQAGGIATPNVALTGLSTKLGPVAGKLADAVTDTFDPKAFFGGLPGGQESLLLGSFALSDILPLGSLSGDAPHMDTSVVDDPVRGRLAVTRYTWETTPKKYPEGGGIVTFLPQRTSRLAIDARVESSLSGGEGRSTITGVLSDFQLEFLKAVTVHFDEFAFTSASGSKLDVSVALRPEAPIVFGGDLDFLRQLAELIPPGLFGDGPSLDISPEGVALGFDIGLPPLTVGVFTLRNLGLNAGLRLPFMDGRPQLDFGFARREAPFLLTVSLLGGGGFVHLQLDTTGLKIVEAALEFGASVDLDIGVASGNVHVFAGIYFKLEKKDGGDLQVVLAGFLRLGGAVSVLGIITISVEFNLSFSYDSGTNKVTGRATLTVNIEVAFFSTSVELSVERSFGRDGGDPAFGDLVHAPAVWADYADAFA